MTQRWSFTPVDTLFFRDSTPYEAGTVNMVQPKSVFPPTIFPLQGAIRTALALEMKWRPGRDFPSELGNEEDLGNLHLKGPFIAKDEKLYFPMPLVLYGDYSEEEDRWSFLQRLTPGLPIKSDLDEDAEHGLRFLQAVNWGKGSVLECWGTEKALAQVLEGDVPDPKELLSPKKMWKHEQRIGIQLDLKQRKVKGGHLYASSHVRTREGITLEVEVDGADEICNFQKKIVPLGGEGRFAGVEVKKGMLPLPEAPTLKRRKDGKCLYTLSLLTPGLWMPEKLREIIRNGPPEAPGKCISASIAKVWRIGGWNLKQRRTREIRPFLPPGSTWFFEADEGDEAAILRLNHTQTGEKKAYGLGHLVVGTWEDKEEEQC
ncbi:MAG: type III-B CRISPR module-associated Cmr3 family protein [Thermoactinomyces sp.]